MSRCRSLLQFVTDVASLQAELYLPFCLMQFFSQCCCKTAVFSGFSVWWVHWNSRTEPVSHRCGRKMPVRVSHKRLPTKIGRDDIKIFQTSQAVFEFWNFLLCFCDTLGNQWIFLDTCSIDWHSGLTGSRFRSCSVCAKQLVFRQVTNETALHVSDGGIVNRVKLHQINC